MDIIKTNQENEVLVAKTTIIPYTIMQDDMFIFNDMVNKFKEDNAGKIKEVHYSHSAIMISVTPPTKIPGFRDMAPAQMNLKCVFIAYFLYEVTMEEYQEIKKQLKLV